MLNIKVIIMLTYASVALFNGNKSFVVCASDGSDESGKDNGTKQSQNKESENENIGTDYAEDQQLKIFQSLFIKKNAEYRDAIKSIMKYELVKQYQLIEIVFTKALQVLEDSQVKLREAGYVPGMKFPVEEHIREALSLCLENTSFLSELILHFPDLSQRLLNAKKSWSLIITWGVFFASQSNFLDKKTKELVYLVSQELGLAEKDPNYVNPYVTFKKPLKSNYEKDVMSQKKKKKKSFKRGPSFSRNLEDL